MQAHEFDEWRRRYHEMSFEEHAAFYAKLHAEHPDQKHFSLESALGFFWKIGGEPRVRELGGFDGALADACLKEFPGIQTWSNYDLAAPQSQCADVRYSVHPLRSPLWYREGMLWHADVFLASHVIEHLSECDFSRMVDWVDGAGYIYFDAPLKAKEFTDWTGATAAHKLTFSWEAVDALVCSYGYERFEVPGPAHCYRRPK